MCFLSPIRLAVLVAAGLFTAGGTASAGWVCIKNESKVAVVIQELPDNPAVKRGKVVRLLPGETYREYHPAPGEKRVVIVDASRPALPLFRGTFAWPRQDSAWRLRPDGTALRLTPVRRDGVDDQHVTVTAAADPK